MDGKGAFSLVLAETYKNEPALGTTEVPDVCTQEEQINLMNTARK